MSSRAVRFRIHGRVQGVWFRAWTRERAGALELTGWVRNEADGTVTGLIAGPEAAVAQMLAELRHGPAHARVQRVETEAADPVEAQADFRVLR